MGYRGKGGMEQKTLGGWPRGRPVMEQETSGGLLGGLADREK